MVVKKNNPQTIRQIMSYVLENEISLQHLELEPLI